MGEGTDVGAEISGSGESVGDAYGFYESAWLIMWSRSV